MKKRDFKTDVENGLYTKADGISSLIPYELNGIYYAVGINTEPLLKNYIAAAIVTYQNSDKKAKFKKVIKKINKETCLEDYSSETLAIKFGSIRQIAIENVFTASQIISNYSKWCKRKDISYNPFFQFFTTSMNRLQASFKAAVILLNHGFFVEAIPIYRLIFEQLAFGAFLLCETDEDKIMKNQVQKNVSHLKTVLDDERIGKLYSYLSSEAHLEPKEIDKYVFYDENDNSIVVKNRSGIECDKETGTLLFLIEIYGEIIWQGLNYFGFTVPNKSYFEDWYNMYRTLTDSLYASLEK